MASSDDQAQDQFDRMKAEVDAEAVQALLRPIMEGVTPEGGMNADDFEEVVTIWATVQYEEGTSGPLKVVEGILVDDDAGITVFDPESGQATTIGDRFIVRADMVQVEAEQEGIDPDQVDTSADRFRA